MESKHSKQNKKPSIYGQLKRCKTKAQVIALLKHIAEKMPEKYKI